MEGMDLAQIYRMISIVSFAVAGVCFVVSIALFIKFRIPTVIGDLSGRTARKSIAQMRSENEKTGKKSFRPHPVASDRGTLTEPIKQVSNSKSQKINKKTVPKNPIPGSSGGVGSETTGKLDDITTDPLNFTQSGTEVLSEGTQVLSNEQIQLAINQKVVNMKMIQNIVFVHTDEEI